MGVCGGQYMYIVVWGLVSADCMCGMVGTGVSYIDMMSCVFSSCGCVQHIYMCVCVCVCIVYLLCIGACIMWNCVC